MDVATTKVLAMDLGVEMEMVKRVVTDREKGTVQDLAMKTGLVMGSVMEMVIMLVMVLVVVLDVVAVKEVVTALVLEGGIGSRFIFMKTLISTHHMFKEFAEDSNKKNGQGSVSGSDTGHGSGCGTGNEMGFGYGDGFGSGGGCGNNDGWGDGDGFGSGSGKGNGVSFIIG